MPRPDPASRPLTPKFGPTSGGVSGGLGVLCGVVIVVSALVHGVEASEWPFIPGGLFVVAASWAVLLRPKVLLDPDEIVLRNVVSDHRVPYARVEEFFVRSTTVVMVDGRRYRGLGVSRTMRQMTRRQRTPSDPITRSHRFLPDDAPLRRPGAGQSVADQLEDQVAERVKVAVASDAAVRRVPARAEIAALAVTAIAFVVALAL